MFQEFKKFILRGNVVDLAVGIVVGAAFTTVVNAFVRDVINPILPSAASQGDFAKKAFTVGSHKFLYGDLIMSIITFLIVAAVVFFLVVQPINKLSAIAIKDKKSDDDGTKKCPHCLGKIPEDATKCQFCTSDLSKK